MRRQYVVYDGRAILGGTDEAMVFCCEDTLEEAKESARDFGETAIYSYAVDAEDVATDERLECVTDADGRVLG